jgi:hypothetical protein
VAGYTQPAAGISAYSEHWTEIIIAGSTITSNVIASFDEGATGWTGTLGGTAYVADDMVITSGIGNILDITDYLNTPDLINYGGEGSGTYEIPVDHQIDVGRVVPCNVLITWSSTGQGIDDNILTVADYLADTDILDAAAAQNTDIYPEIALSQDGVTFGAWQKYAVGAYIAQKFKARMQIQTNDPQTQAILKSFVFSVDVPDRDDHYINVPILAGGTTITWQPDGASSPAAFNGGPAGSPDAPNIQVSILNAQLGDTMVLSSVGLSSATIQILNVLGVGAARNVNVLAQGY